MGAREGTALHGSIPLRALLVIGVIVLLVHALLLQALPSAPLAIKPPAMRAFTTRTVTLNAPAPKSEPAPKPKPISPRKPRPEAARPQPTSPTPPQVPEPVTADAGATAPQAAPEPSPVAPTPATASEAVATNPSADPALNAPPALPPRETPVGASVLSIPGSARLKYDVTGEAKGLTYSARAQLLWLQDGSNYNTVLEVSAFLLGSFSQMSSGQITTEGLAPTRFADKRRTEVAAHFERDKGKVTFSANTPDAPLLAGAQDRLSVIFQLVAMFAGDPGKYPPATTITLPIVGPREAEIWLFTVDGAETMALPIGQMQAIKVSRNPRREFDQKIEVWFAPSLGYMPVRVKATQANGDFVDQKLRGVEKP